MSKIEWSGITASFEHIHDKSAENPSNTPKGISKQWFLDAQWTDCPIEVQEEVRCMWRSYECGNDKYMIKTCLNTLMESDDLGEYSTKAIVQYLTENGVTDPEEMIIIHYWW